MNQLFAYHKLLKKIVFADENLGELIRKYGHNLFNDFTAAQKESMLSDFGNYASISVNGKPSYFFGYKIVDDEFYTGSLFQCETQEGVNFNFVLESLEAFAKSKNCKTIVGQTARPALIGNLTGNGWKLSEIILRKTL